jgi:hypothetical protein
VLVQAASQAQESALIHNGSVEALPLSTDVDTKPARHHANDRACRFARSLRWLSDLN